jgi:hypothetical protein
MISTSAADVLPAAFNAFEDAERAEVFAELQKERLASRAASDDISAEYVASLKRVYKHLSEMPTSSTFTRARAELRDEGELGQYSTKTP